MVQFTGNLLGKVQLDGAIRSEILTSLVESLVQRYQSSSSDHAKKLIKFNDNNRYAVECTERGLKLTSSNLTKSKDEGFESDCDSIRSGKVTEGISSSSSSSSNAVELDLSGLMDFLDISKEKETDGQVASGSRSSNVIGRGDVESSLSHNLHNSLSSGGSSGGSLDNTSISSNSNLHAASCTDDSNSSSGNGSDSDEFCCTSGDKPWEPLPNVSSFQSYPIEDVVFCHCDTLHSSTLVWVVRHLSKMIALVIAFRTRTDASNLFQIYRELRVKLKPVKYGSNTSSSSSSSGAGSGGSSNVNSNSSFDDTYITRTTNGLPRPGTPASDIDSLPFTSLPVVYPTEILHETLKSPIFSSTKSLNFDTKSLSSSSAAINLDMKEPVKLNTFGVRSHLNSSPGTSSIIPMQSIFSSSLSASNPFLSSHYRLGHHGEEEDDNEEDEDETETETEDEDSADDDDEVSSPPMMESLKFNTAPKSFTSSFFNQSNNHNNSVRSKFSTNSKILSSISPIRTNTGSSTVKAKTTSRKTVSSNKKPILLVPLKTESVTTPRSRYPKESYLYHVMGRSSSTFAPYQRSFNFISSQHGGGGAGNGLYNGQDTSQLGWNNPRHQQCIPFPTWLELAEMPKIPHAGTTGRKFVHHGTLKHKSRSASASSSSLANLKGSKGTSKILLRDASGYHHGMWATLSQRFKRNLRDNLMPKLNWMWTPQGHQGQNRPRKKTNKEVTFNAWATVQMI